MNNSSGGSGIGVAGCTFIVFLILKLTGVITWSWWWVTAPLWGAMALILAICLGLFIVAIGCAVLAKMFK